MHVLALDTTTRAGSVALVSYRDGVDSMSAAADSMSVAAGSMPAFEIDVRSGDGSRTHAERLPAEILALVGDHGLALPAIDVFAVASGPGSFTGLRIGIAMMQGLASATRRPLLAVSALEALAQLAAVDLEPDAHVAAWMDGYRRDVFAALYQVSDAPAFDGGRLVELESPTVEDPAHTLTRWVARRGARSISFVGDGAVLYAETIREHGPGGSRVIAAPALAGAVARMAGVRARRGERPPPAAAQPLYVRRPDAEVARERSGR